MIARLAPALGLGAIGAAMGVLWLLFVGVPFFAPSYLDLAIKHRVAEAAAGAQQARGDAIEDLRKGEAEEAVAATETERSNCEARLAVRDRLHAAELARCLGREPDDAESPQCGDFRPLRDSLRDAGLVDG